MKIKPKISEANVKIAVFHYLQIKDYHWWPINNVGIWDAEKQIYRRSRTIKHGVPDAQALINGIHYDIELKGSTGGQSKAQKEFQRKTEASGGVYLLVRSIDDLQEAGL